MNLSKGGNTLPCRCLDVNNMRLDKYDLYTLEELWDSTICTDSASWTGKGIVDLEMYSVLKSDYDRKQD